ncbi:MAG TPA: RNA polymerase subunit sigma-70 [Polyangiaceae bacterium]|nr:RNA polymerase subunit sigma-70 [Polyangiaceae bacterium]
MVSPSHEFESLVAPHRRELHAYCYRMLGSLQDAEDALQETLLGAWKGLAGFEGRSALKSWLYRIATNACLRVIEQRPARILPYDRAPASHGSVVEPVIEGVPWLDPYPVALDASFEQRESLELAFVAALQHLPAAQRATLILREVLEFSAAEVAELLNSSVPAINSALQRAKGTVSARVPPLSQQATLAQLGELGRQSLVQAYVKAWAEQDAAALVALLTHDVRFTMPPIPSWFDGREAVVRFFSEPVFRTPWRLQPTWASGQLAFAAYQGPDFRLGALNVVRLREGKIAELTGFLQPAVHAFFSLPGR